MFCLQLLGCKQRLNTWKCTEWISDTFSWLTIFRKLYSLAHNRNADTYYIQSILFLVEKFSPHSQNYLHRPRQTSNVPQMLNGHLQHNCTSWRQIQYKNTLSYRCRDYYEETVLRPPYLKNWKSYTTKIPLNWVGQGIIHGSHNQKGSFSW